MSLHTAVHFTTRSGDLSTIWERPAVQTLREAEVQVRTAVAKARRIGGRELKVDVFDDLACKSVFRGRVK